MSVSPKVRAVVVDDEPPARAQIRALLEGERDLQPIGEAGGGSAAILLIREHRPDLVFLDVQMPGCDGFEVLRAVAPDMPAVIFVTAYDQHAIHAFEVAAVDYLLKPVVESRFREAVRRAVDRIRRAESGAIAQQLSALLEQVPRPAVDRIPIAVDGRVVFVDTESIDWIDADDDHLRVHAGNATYVTRETMAHIESRLPGGFIRVRRSCIVNQARIREAQPWVKGDYVLILQNGARVTTGRTYRDRVRALLSG
jgi:two-component system, LytTR family, response regulator